MLPPKVEDPVEMTGPTLQNIKDGNNALPVEGRSQDEAISTKPVTSVLTEQTQIETERKEKPKRKDMGRPMSDLEYEEIFAAVLARAYQDLSPVADQENHIGNDGTPCPPQKVCPEVPPKSKKPLVEQVINEVKPSQSKENQTSGKRKIPTQPLEKKSAFSVKKQKGTPKEPDVPKPATCSEASTSLSKSKLVTSHQKVTKQVNGTSEKNRQKKAKTSKDVMVNHEVEQNGTWVQCSLKSCSKWRYLADVHDPTCVPDVWICDMNKDPAANSCDVPQVPIEPEQDLEEFVYTKYTEGSVVWARLAGYPWWPAMVEIDPDYEMYAECRDEPNVASHYHVVFLDNHVSRAWCRSEALRPYTGQENFMGSTKVKGHNYEKAIREAQTRADTALMVPLDERIGMFSFAKTFKGKWGSCQSDQEDTVEVLKVRSPSVPGRSPVCVPGNWGQDAEETEEFGTESELYGLSGDQVDEILGNAESIIESAHEAIEDLLSPNDEDPSFAPSPPAKKKTPAKRARKDEKPTAAKKAKASTNKKTPAETKIIFTSKAAKAAKAAKARVPMMPPKKNAAARNINLQKEPVHQTRPQAEVSRAKTEVKQVIQVTMEVDNQMVTMEVDPPEAPPLGSQQNCSQQSFSPATSTSVVSHQGAAPSGMAPPSGGIKKSTVKQTRRKPAFQAPAVSKNVAKESSQKVDKISQKVDKISQIEDKKISQKVDKISQIEDKKISQKVDKKISQQEVKKISQKVDKKISQQEDKISQKVDKKVDKNSQDKTSSQENKTSTDTSDPERTVDTIRPVEYVELSIDDDDDDELVLPVTADLDVTCDRLIPSSQGSRHSQDFDFEVDDTIGAGKLGPDPLFSQTLGQYPDSEVDSADFSE